MIKEGRPTSVIPKVDLFSFVFMKEFENTKKTFRN